MNGITRYDIDHAEPRVVALAHPSLDRLVETFATQLRRDSRHDSTIDTRVTTSSSDQMAPRTLRLGLIVADRLISIVSVDADADGCAAIATLRAWQGSGVDRQLLSTAIERSLKLANTVPVFRCDRLDPSLIGLALSCGAEVTGRAPVRRLAPV